MDRAHVAQSEGKIARFAALRDIVSVPIGPHVFVCPSDLFNHQLKWTPSFGQENAEIKLGFQARLD